MKTLNPLARAVWLWLNRHGGAWTSLQVAHALHEDPREVFRALHDMARRGVVHVAEPADDSSSQGQRRQRYMVTTDCFVPMGMRVGEVRKLTAPPASEPAPRPARTLQLPYGLSPAELPYLHRLPAAPRQEQLA